MDDAEPAWHNAYPDFRVLKLFQICCGSLPSLHIERFACLELFRTGHQRFHQRISMGRKLAQTHIHSKQRFWCLSNWHRTGQYGHLSYSARNSDASGWRAVLLVHALLTSIHLIADCVYTRFGLFISSVAVFFPDVAEMYQVLLTAWLYLTPIIYPESLMQRNGCPSIK